MGERQTASRRGRTRRWGCRIAAPAVLMLLAGCGGDRIAAPYQITGSYQLRQVAGTALPSTIVNDGSSRVEIVGGSVDLDSDSTWIGRTNFRIITQSGTSHDTQLHSGRWGLTGDTIRFEAAAQVVGVARRDTLLLLRRMNGEETAYVYVR